MKSAAATENRVLEFGDFRLDVRRRHLTRRSSGAAIPLTSVAFETLLQLAVHSGQVVTKGALLENVWPHVTVVENSVNQCIASLRRALGDDAASPRYIETVSGRGYRFLPTVSSDDGLADDPIAYQHYIAGWSALTRPGSRTLEAALGHLQTAIARAPDMAIAHIALAECLGLLLAHGLRRASEIAEPMYLAAVKAFTLAPDLPEAHVMMGRLKAGVGDFAAAAEGYARAFELNPRCYLALKWSGADMMALGRFDEAIAFFRRAQAVEPLAVNIHSHVAMAFYFSGRYREAVEQLEFTLKLDDTFEIANAFMGRALVELGEYDRAITYFERSPVGIFGRISGVPITLARMGRTDEARAALSALLAQTDRPVRPHDAASILAALGEDEAALDWVGRVTEDWAPFPFMMVDPIFRSVVANPRLADVAAKISAEIAKRIADDMAAKGWPSDPTSAPQQDRGAR